MGGLTDDSPGFWNKGITMEQLAIIRKVGFGNRDIGRPCLWFGTYISEAGTALQVFVEDDALALIKQMGVYDIKELEGRACWVEVTTGTIKFKRLADI